MTQYTITKGSRQVIICEDLGKVSARLYLNHGETAGYQSWRGKTRKGAERWAQKVLSQ